MPQVQVLPQVQSPLEQLQPYINNFTQSIGHGLSKRAQNKQNLSAMNALQSASGPLDQIAAITQFSPETQKTISPLLSSYIRTQSASNISQQRASAQEQEKQEELEGIKNTLNRVEELIPYGGTWGFKALAGKIPFTEAAGKREELDKSGILAADAVYTKFNKGVLNKVKWEDVKDLFSPRAALSDVENQARINSLRNIMGLPSDISSDKLNSVIKKEEKNIIDSSKTKHSKKQSSLDKETASQILKEAGGDKIKAREIAQSLGYEF